MDENNILDIVNGFVKDHKIGNNPNLIVSKQVYDLYSKALKSKGINTEGGLYVEGTDILIVKGI